MLCMKRNCLAIIIMVASVILFDDSQAENTNWLTCRIRLKKRFGKSTPLLDRIKQSITEMFKFDDLEKDVVAYINEFSLIVDSTRINPQIAFCLAETKELPIRDILDEYDKCHEQIKDFGTKKTDFLKNAIYNYKCGDDFPWNSIFVFKTNSYGCKYLKHIASVITLNEDARLLEDYDSFCETYVQRILSEGNQENQPTSSTLLNVLKHLSIKH